MTLCPSELQTSTIEISEQRLKHNFETLTGLLPKQTLMLPMVKANAYGHGSDILADILASLPIAGVGLATIAEAINLRVAGFKQKVLCFGRINPSVLTQAKTMDITVVLHSILDAECFASSSAKPHFHIEIETGMHRLGLPEQSLKPTLKILKPDLKFLEGVCSHFAKSEEPHSLFTQTQAQLFLECARMMEDQLGKTLIKHLGNSGSILSGFEHHLDWIRPGLALYGYLPQPLTTPKLAPIMTWKAPIVQIKFLKAGDHVGYGCSFQASKPMAIATVAVGYGDGFMRAYADVRVALNHQTCAIVGSICMDLMMIDITHIKDANIGDQVYLLGDGTHGEPTAETYAKVDQTISYEVLTRINQRVTRRAV